MLDGAGEKDGSEGRGVIGEATLTRGVETLSGAFKATVLIVLDRAPTIFICYMLYMSCVTHFLFFLLFYFFYNFCLQKLVIYKKVSTRKYFLRMF